VIANLQIGPRLGAAHAAGDSMNPAAVRDALLRIVRDRPIRRARYVATKTLD
jgi:hypothetical protein